MHVFKKDKGFFVIENKNTHEILILPIKMTDERRELVERIFEWMRTVKQASDEDKLPKRPFTKKSWNCQSCPVRNTCWPEGSYRRNSPNDPVPGEIEIAPLEVPR